jgi:tRNA dimethylallyltransferase
VLLAGGSGLYFRAIVDDLEFPPTDPAVRHEIEREAVSVGARGLHRRLEGLDPAAAARIEPENVRRTVRALEVAELTGRPFSSYAMAWDEYPRAGVRAAGLRPDPATLGDRIETRVREQVADGLLDEVRALGDRGLSGWLIASRTIGYAEFARHLEGELTLEEAIAGTVKRTKALARRQLAWFRRDPRIRWFDASPDHAHLVDDLTEYLGG